ncbi:MAG: hypothetical protein ACN6PF_20410 [Achromobacter veterisilvae]
MIDALIAGKVYGQPKKGMGKNGSPYVTAKVRAAGGDGEVLFVNVITFSESAGQALLAQPSETSNGSTRRATCHRCPNQRVGICAAVGLARLHHDKQDRNYPQCDQSGGIFGGTFQF